MTRRTVAIWVLCAVIQLPILLQPASMAQQATPGGASKPRVIVTTDGEQDDLASMHRFILYVNDLDVAGIVQTSSRSHHAGDASAVPPIPSVTWLGSDWIHAIIQNDEVAAADDSPDSTRRR